MKTAGVTYHILNSVYFSQFVNYNINYNLFNLQLVSYTTFPRLWNLVFHEPHYEVNILKAQERCVTKRQLWLLQRFSHDPLTFELS